MGNAAWSFDQDRTDRSAIVYLLRDRSGFTTAGEIRSFIGMSPVRVRQLAQLYPTLLVSSIEGYKLTDNATRGEILHNVQSLLKRAAKISERASQLASRL